MPLGIGPLALAHTPACVSHGVWLCVGLAQPAPFGDGGVLYGSCPGRLTFYGDVSEDGLPSDGPEGVSPRTNVLSHIGRTLPGRGPFRGRCPFRGLWMGICVAHALSSEIRSAHISASLFRRTGVSLWMLPSLEDEAAGRSTGF
jgi:hypothetical protein